MNKKGKANPYFWGFLVFVVLLVFNVGGFTDYLASLIPEREIPKKPTPEVPCLYDGATMTIGPMKEKWNPSTSMSTQYANYWLNGVDKGRKVDSGTESVTFGDEIELLYGMSAGTHYLSHHKFTAPCAATFSSADKDIDPTKLHELYAYADIDTKYKIICDDDGNVMAGDVTEDLANGEDVTLMASITGVYEDAFSPYGKVPVVCEYDNKYIEDFILQDASGKDFPIPATPPQFTVSNSSFTFVVYEMPQVISNEKHNFQIYIKADDTNNPTIGDGSGANLGGGIGCYAYDQDYYINDQTNEVEFGVANRTRGDVGQLSGSSGAVANFTVKLA